MPEANRRFPLFLASSHPGQRKCSGGILCRAALHRRNDVGQGRLERGRIATTAVDDERRAPPCDSSAATHPDFWQQLSLICGAGTPVTVCRTPLIPVISLSPLPSKSPSPGQPISAASKPPRLKPLAAVQSLNAKTSAEKNGHLNWPHTKRSKRSCQQAGTRPFI